VLGKVTLSKGVNRGSVKVVQHETKAGTVLEAGAKVAVTLG
jgi:hypothetical protein